MASLKCTDDTVIEYRLPNVIELLELKHNSGWGSEGASGHSMIAGVLKNAEPFILSVKGKKDFKQCIDTRCLAEDLSTLALNLVRDELDDEEKKS